MEMRVREISHVLKPLLRPIPHPFFPFFVREPGTAQEVYFPSLLMNVRIWKSQDLLLLNTKMVFQLFFRFIHHLSTIAVVFRSVIHRIPGRGFAPSSSSSYQPELIILCLLWEYWELLKFSTLFEADTGSKCRARSSRIQESGFVHSSGKQPFHLYIL